MGRGWVGKVRPVRHLSTMSDYLSLLGVGFGLDLHDTHQLEGTGNTRVQRLAEASEEASPHIAVSRHCVTSGTAG
jgi:hypothetical protein